MELIYHYLWKHRLLGMPLHLNDGREVRIISPGIHNNDAGPDFSNAIIVIGEDTWAGNVEIHVKASDWYRHAHHNDPAYDNIILHLVAEDDTQILRADGTIIPQAVVTPPENFFCTYASLTSGLKGIRCAPLIADLPDLIADDWLESVAVERLHIKASRILQYLQQCHGDWEQALFITLARALGFGLNGIPFEMLAKSIPLKIAYRHADSILQIEALLFGQAGMLSPTLFPLDDYYQRLLEEYQFLANKYGLKPMRRDLWKYARTRPGNFPHRRIALLAQIIHEGQPITGTLLDTEGDCDAIIRAFSWRLQGYWATHHDFGSNQLHTEAGALSRPSIESLAVNVAAPFFAAYGNATADIELAQHAPDILEAIAAERNSVVNAWATLGPRPLKAKNAWRSQALIHLRQEYCDKERCLECRFGHFLLRDNAADLSLRQLSPRAVPDTPPRDEAPFRQLSSGVLVAIDSFKGCLTSLQAGNAVAKGLRRALRHNRPDIDIAAVADGGEGMADAIGEYRKLDIIEVDTLDPLMRPIKATYRMDTDIRTAFIDIAAAAGLTLLSQEERNPMHTTTFGTGIMIRDAVTQGCDTIVLGLGGTATSDAGLGIMQALGAEILLDGDILPSASPICAGSLNRILHIDTTHTDRLLEGVRLMLACDVSIPYIGPRGAARVFAPQKGASPEEVRIIEAGMRRLNKIILGMTGIDLQHVKASGAAGGTAGTLMALASAEIFSGTDIVAHCIDLHHRLEGKNLLITGEGHADRQTLYGKLPLRLMQIAATRHIPTILLTGKADDIDALRNAGFADIIDINKDADPTVDPLIPKTATKRLEEAAANLQPYHF